MAAEVPTEIVTPPIRDWNVWSHASRLSAEADFTVSASKHWITSEGDLQFGTDYYTSHSFMRGTWSRVFPAADPS